MSVYAKVFRQIYDSSIADDWQVRVVFEDMLVLADSDGVVDMTPEAIAARTRIPLPVISRALTVLGKPDPKSRTLDEDGRRLVLLDSHRTWGWRIVNYEKYRSIKCEFDRRTYMRKYMRNKRKGGVKLSVLPGSNNNLTPPSPSSSVLSSERGEGENSLGGSNTVPWEACLKWLKSSNANGSDYTEDETRRAWLALNANGWMWGRNPVADYRSAIESRIQDNRARSLNGKPSKQSDIHSEYGTREQAERVRAAEMEYIKGLQKEKK